MSTVSVSEEGNEGISSADEEISSYVARAQATGLENVSALSAFQKRMEQYPQLSADAQRSLALEYQKSLTSKEELIAMRQSHKGSGIVERRKMAALDREVARGEYAIEHLVGSNFKLVWLIVRENVEGRYGAERASDLLPDMLNDANEAVVMAIRDFDPVRCPTFATYLARVVRDHVRMKITHTGPLRLAPSWVRLKRIASHRIPALASELGRAPKKEEIQEDLTNACLAWAEKKLTEEQLTLPEDEKRDLKMSKLRKQGMLGAIRDIDDVLTATQSMASLDLPVGSEEGGSSLGDLLPAGRGDNAFSSLELSELSSTLKNVLAGLNDRERDILLYRFGFVDGKEWTYAKIAAKYDVTAERIRQIERSVLGRLSGSGKLQGFLPGSDL